MISFFRKLGSVILILLVCQQSLATPGAWSKTGTIDDDIHKYRHLTVENELLQRLRRFESLISYFTGITYVKKNQLVHPDFLRALILAESAADPQAISSRNARGLCQIIPATGKRAAAELAAAEVDFKFIDESRLSDLRAQDLHDPAINILLACYLISRYNKRFDGKIELVLSAWNAGEYHPGLKRGIPAYNPETEQFIGRVNGFFLFLFERRSA